MQGFLFQKFNLRSVFVQAPYSVALEFVIVVCLACEICTLTRFSLSSLLDD